MLCNKYKHHHSETLFVFTLLVSITRPTISHKNSETCTPCSLIQCWVQVCLVIPDHHCLAYLCACLTLFSHEYWHACSLAYFLEYVLWSISSTLGWRMWIIFKYQKFSFRVLLSIYVIFCKFWPGVAYKSVAYKKTPLSRELQCNVILHCITSYTLEHFYLQCISMFSLVCYCFYLLFPINFSDAAGQEHSYLDEIPVER